MLMGVGGLSILLAPGNAGVWLAAAGVLLEALGVVLRHRER